jgi:hypothetical protein
LNRFTRREFIQAGVGASALLFVAGCAGRVRSEAIPALVPVVLAGVLPEDPAARAAAVAETVEAFHRAVGGLAPAIQREIADLVGLLDFAPTRWLVAGMASSWREASPQRIAQFLEDWRHSRSSLKRSGYRALTQLIQGAWFDNPRAWSAIGYPGPPQISSPLGEAGRG